MYFPAQIKHVLNTLKSQTMFWFWPAGNKPCMRAMTT